MEAEFVCTYLRISLYKTDVVMITKLPRSTTKAWERTSHKTCSISNARNRCFSEVRFKLLPEASSQEIFVQWQEHSALSVACFPNVSGGGVQFRVCTYVESFAHQERDRVQATYSLLLSRPQTCTDQDCTGAQHETCRCLRKSPVPLVLTGCRYFNTKNASKLSQK